jgi:hypothetical protein
VDSAVKLVCCLLALLTLPASAQRLSDGELRTHLQQYGERLSTKRATLYFEPQGLTPEQRKEFADLVDQGIRHVQSFLKLPGRKDKLEYYVSARVRISHFSGAGIFLPLQRVAERNAPYLHETAHALIPGDTRSVWLAEGFASFVESSVSEKYGGYAGRVFVLGGNREVDREAQNHLETDGGKNAVVYIAAHGVPRGFYYDRLRVAAPYYVLAHSFIKFLVAKTGLKRVLALHRPEDAVTALEESTGKTAELWRSEWLASIMTRTAAAASP